MNPSQLVAAICLFILFISSAGNAEGRAVTFYVHNKCPFPIWPATAPNNGFPVVADGGFYLPSGRTRRVPVPWKWTGRMWARTGCNFNSSSAGGRACQTGDCDSRLQCAGLAGTPPATLVQVSVRADDTKLDFYDVSIVDGYNLPVSVSARGSNADPCSIGGCAKDINKACPNELKVFGGGAVVACKSACLAFNADAFCCRNEFGSPEKCGPSVYSKAFKEACPSYYSYAFDSPAPLITCGAKDYAITFCPSGWGGDAHNLALGSVDVDH